MACTTVLSRFFRSIETFLALSATFWEEKMCAMSNALLTKQAKSKQWKTPWCIKICLSAGTFLWVFVMPHWHITNYFYHLLMSERQISGDIYRAIPSKFCFFQNPKQNICKNKEKTTTCALDACEQKILSSLHGYLIYLIYQRKSYSYHHGIKHLLHSNVK